MKKINVRCECCGKKFLKEENKIILSKRKGWKNYCSNQCRLNKTNKKNNFFNKIIQFFK